MKCPDIKDAHLSQLRAVVQSPIIQLDYENRSTVFNNASDLLNNLNHCCIFIAASTSSNKLQNIRHLYRSLALLKSLQRQFRKKHWALDTYLIGIYPSLEYPACVYELNTAADHYVSNNVMPVANSALVHAFKQVISKVLGVNLAVGGLGLCLHME